MKRLLCTLTLLISFFLLANAKQTDKSNALAPTDSAAADTTGNPAPMTGGVQLSDFVSLSQTLIEFQNPLWVYANVQNNSSATLKADYCAEVFDTGMKYLENVQTLSGLSLAPGASFKNELVFSRHSVASMIPGTYYVRIFYRPEGGEWTLVPDNGVYKNMVRISVTFHNDIELYSDMSITPGTTLVQGQPVSVSLEVLNNGDHKFHGDYQICLCNAAGAYYFVAGQSDNTLCSHHHSKNPIVFSTNSLEALPGSYWLSLGFAPDTDDIPQYAGASFHSNFVMVNVVPVPTLPDQYEPNNTVDSAYELPVYPSGKTVSVQTTGSNCHIAHDEDYYKIILSPGYNYDISARLQDSRSNDDGRIYSLDAVFSWSKDKIHWSALYDDVMPKDITVSGADTIYFKVGSYFGTETGTYLLDLHVTRSQSQVTGIAAAQTDVGEPDIYPNPASDFINTNLSGLNSECRSLTLCNMQGQELSRIDGNAIEKNMSIPVDNLPPGIYFLRIRTDADFITRKFVVSR
jgi:hypothetical protein